MNNTFYTLQNSSELIPKVIGSAAVLLLSKVVVWSGAAVVNQKLAPCRRS